MKKNMSKGSHQMKLKCCKISEWTLGPYLKWDGNLKRNRNMQALIGQMHKSIPSTTKLACLLWGIVIYGLLHKWPSTHTSTHRSQRESTSRNMIFIVNRNELSAKEKQKIARGKLILETTHIKCVCVCVSSNLVNVERIDCNCLSNLIQTCNGMISDIWFPIVFWMWQVQIAIDIPYNAQPENEIY